MKKTFIIISILLLVAGCSKTKEQKKEPKKKISGCVPYFEFDQIEHYRIEIDDGQISMENSGDPLTDIVSGDLPNSMDQVKELPSLVGLGYKMKMIPKDRYPELKSFFCDKEFGTLNASMCIPVYRDILVFKNNNTITGFSKICFACDQSSIVAVNRSPESFRNFTSFNRLEELLQ